MEEEKKRNYHHVKPGQKVIVRTVKPFSNRGAYVYLPKSWLGKKVQVRLYGSGSG
jgi:putative transposon-encoded protein